MDTCGSPVRIRMKKRSFKEFELEITEGEEDLDFVTLLTKVKIKLLLNAPKNARVTVKMELNKNQLLHVYVKVHTVPEENRSWYETAAEGIRRVCNRGLSGIF